jgi:hypothetical protein
VQPAQVFHNALLRADAEVDHLARLRHVVAQLFSASNQQLMDSLQRIEGAIQQSMARSDDQLGYYVAQAREVIDLSISAQQGIVEDMRSLRASKPALPNKAAAPVAQGAV